jgi:hypothetical protein
MQWIDTLILVFILLLFVLNFIPFFTSESESWIAFVNYATAIIAIYESYIHKQWKFISLIALTVLIHLVTDSCRLEESCISQYQEIDFPAIEKYFTLYSMLHLLSYVSLDLETIEIYVPVFVFISIASVNISLDALILALVGVVLFINLVVKQTNYHLEDIVLFCVFFFVASLFYFLRIDATDEQSNDLKRFFLFFYFLAFSISTGIKKEGVVHNLRLFTRLCGGTKEKEGNDKGMSVSYAKIPVDEMYAMRIDLQKIN